MLAPSNHAVPTDKLNNGQRNETGNVWSFRRAEIIPKSNVELFAAKLGSPAGTKSIDAIVSKARSLAFHPTKEADEEP